MRCPVCVTHQKDIFIFSNIETITGHYITSKRECMLKYEHFKSVESFLNLLKCLVHKVA